MSAVATALRVAANVNDLLVLPHLRIGLARKAAEKNHPFFLRAVDDFYREATRRRARFLLVPRMRYGVALCDLAATSENYSARIEPSARRNVKKAVRNGYRFARIEYNELRKDIAQILRSAPIRQGPMPADLVSLDEVPPVANPVSRDPTHDYPYFGVLHDNKLCGYAGCLVAGQLLAIEDFYGHGAHQADGVMPLMLVEMAQYARDHYPAVRYYVYDTYFGASDSLRRFKKKFNFMPHKVTWALD